MKMEFGSKIESVKKNYSRIRDAVKKDGKYVLLLAGLATSPAILSGQSIEKNSARESVEWNDWEKNKMRLYKNFDNFLDEKKSEGQGTISLDQAYKLFTENIKKNDTNTHDTSFEDKTDNGIMRRVDVTMDKNNTTVILVESAKPGNFTWFQMEDGNETTPSDGIPDWVTFGRVDGFALTEYDEEKDKEFERVLDQEEMIKRAWAASPGMDFATFRFDPNSPDKVEAVREAMEKNREIIDQISSLSAELIKESVTESKKGKF